MKGLIYNYKNVKKDFKEELLYRVVVVDVKIILKESEYLFLKIKYRF